MQKCFMSSYLFYYPNKKKQQSLNEECLSLGPPMTRGICQEVEGTVCVESFGV
jgi:hypothetical protein